MLLSLSLATQIGAMFIMIIVGYIMLKREIVDIKDCNVLSMIVLYVCGPCAIIKSFQLDFTMDKVKGFSLAVIVAIIMHIVFMLLTKILGNIFKFTSIEKASLIYSNCGNLIIPLVTLTMSDKMVFYTSAYMMVQITLIWTHCLSLVSKRQKFNIKAIVKNINIIAIIIGIAFFLLQIKLPTMITSAMSSMAALMGPLSMFVVGMLLANMNLKQIFGNKKAYFITFLRLIVYPLIVLLLIRFTYVYTLLPNAREILLVSMLAASAPAASTVTQFAQIYQNHPYESSIINTLTILFCIITMPLITILYSFLVGLN